MHWHTRASYMQRKPAKMSFSSFSARQQVFLLKLSHLKAVYTVKRQKSISFYSLSGCHQLHCHDTKPPFRLLGPNLQADLAQQHFHGSKPWCSEWGMETWLQKTLSLFFPRAVPIRIHKFCVSSTWGFPISHSNQKHALNPNISSQVR